MNAIEQIHSAMAAGAFSNMAHQLVMEARRNPHLDWNETIKHVLSRRVIDVGPRRYETCLIGIPLFGNLGTTFSKTTAIRDVLKAAQRQGLTEPENGLMFVDVPFSRSAWMNLPYEDLYTIPSRLFESGVRGKKAPILDIESGSGDQSCGNSAILIGLLYWRADRAMPALMTDKIAQARLAEIVRQHLLFEYATATTPGSNLQALPMTPFFDATRAFSHRNLRNGITTFVRDIEEPILSATLSVMTIGAGPGDYIGEVVGDYLIEVTLQTDKGDNDQSMILQLNTLFDGTPVDSLQKITTRLAKEGIEKVETRFLSRADNLSDLENDVPTYVATSVH